MQELIRVSEMNGLKVVSARDLHAFLGLKSKFADWFKNRVNKYGFIEGTDFVTVSKNLENGGRELDYGVTLDMAKELAMVQANTKGKEARQYFINIEKAYKQAVSTGEIPAMINHTSRSFQIENVKTANGMIWKRSDSMAIADYHRELAICLTGQTPSQLVREAKEEKLHYKKRSSGREVMRHKFPEAACAASVSDDLVSRGFDLDQIKPVALKMKEAFKGLIQLGLTPKELAA